MGVEKRDKILKLLPSGEGNLQKLKEMVSKKKTKLRGLQDQFELHKASIIEDKDKMEGEIRKLKMAQSQNVLNKEMSTKDHIKWTEEELVDTIGFMILTHLFYTGNFARFSIIKTKITKKK